MLGQTRDIDWTKSIVSFVETTAHGISKYTQSWWIGCLRHHDDVSQQNLGGWIDHNQSNKLKRTVYCSGISEWRIDFIELSSHPECRVSRKKTRWSHMWKPISAKLDDSPTLRRWPRNGRSTTLEAPLRPIFVSSIANFAKSRIPKCKTTSGSTISRGTPKYEASSVELLTIDVESPSAMIRGTHRNRHFPAASQLCLQTSEEQIVLPDAGSSNRSQRQNSHKELDIRIDWYSECNSDHTDVSVPASGSIDRESFRCPLTETPALRHTVQLIMTLRRTQIPTWPFITSFSTPYNIVRDKKFRLSIESNLWKSEMWVRFGTREHGLEGCDIHGRGENVESRSWDSKCVIAFRQLIKRGHFLTSWSSQDQSALVVVEQTGSLSLNSG
jgi:hypothetical protein